MPPPPPTGAAAAAASTSAPRSGAASGPPKRFNFKLPSVSLPTISLPFGNKKKYAPMGNSRDGPSDADGQGHAGMSMASGSTPMFEQNTGYMSTTNLAGGGGGGGGGRNIIGGGDIGYRMADTFDDGHASESQGFIR